ncbi:MAG: Crp/Fnr family transcriptional regulator [Clostridia bacterium]|jgi:CRP-like cAMP-binding protein|nr:Crp/Fnr family transcriptional regulator [Clostridiales bacterium]
MNVLIEALTESWLFKGFGEGDLSKLLGGTRYRVSSFTRDQVIALEGDDASSVGIVLEGTIEVLKTYPSGRSITISRLTRGDIFGEAIIFSHQKSYPATIISSGSSRVFFLSEPDILQLCATNPKFLNNFMGMISNKILMLNERIKSLSYQTIREKIASYLTEEYMKQKTPVIRMTVSRREMAEHFGIPRPSLSRELISMKKDGLIDFDRQTITIKDMEALEDILL